MMPNEDERIADTSTVGWDVEWLESSSIADESVKFVPTFEKQEMFFKV